MSSSSSANTDTNAAANTAASMIPIRPADLDPELEIKIQEVTKSLPPRYSRHLRQKDVATQGTMWKCGNCIQREHDDFIVKQAPDSPLAREIKRKRLQELEAQRKRVQSLVRFHKLSGEKIT